MPLGDIGTGSQETEGIIDITEELIIKTRTKRMRLKHLHLAEKRATIKMMTRKKRRKRRKMKMIILLRKKKIMINKKIQKKR